MNFYERNMPLHFPSCPAPMPLDSSITDLGFHTSRYSNFFSLKRAGAFEAFFMVCCIVFSWSIILEYFFLVGGGGEGGGREKNRTETKRNNPA